MDQIILVHGINNQGKSEQRIIGEWMGALQTVVSPAEMEIINSKSIIAPYYGDVLYEITKKDKDFDNQAIAQSIDELPDDEAKFFARALSEMALEAGMPSELLDAENSDEAIEQSLTHNRYLNTVIKFLEAVSPWHGKYAVKLLKQAYVYLNRANATQAVDSLVAPILSGPPSLIVAHSLGTIVTFKALRELKPGTGHHYITLGSPLGIRAIKNSIGPRYETPESASNWSNGLDKDDFVTLGKRLSKNGYSGTIDENNKINNGRKDPHSIAKYLTDPWVVTRIRAALDMN